MPLSSSGDHETRCLNQCVRPSLRGWLLLKVSVHTSNNRFEPARICKRRTGIAHTDPPLILSPLESVKGSEHHTDLIRRLESRPSPGCILRPRPTCQNPKTETNNARRQENSRLHPAHPLSERLGTLPAPQFILSRDWFSPAIESQTSVASYLCCRFVTSRRIVLPQAV